MSKILLFEPSKLLQHACILALFPEHDVEIIHNVDSSTHGADADLAIIDAAALRIADAETKADNRSRPWHLPTILIGAATISSSHFSEAAVLSMPFTKEQLRAAITQILGRGSAKAAAHSHDSQEVRNRTKSKASNVISSNQDTGDRQVIELVEVFEGEDLDEGGPTVSSRG